MIKAVLFDMDNTLMDFMKMKKLAVREAARAMVQAGLRMSKEEAQEKLFAFYMKNIESDTAFIRFLKTINKNDAKVLAAGINAYTTTKSMHLKPYPEVRETLAALRRKGIKTGVITDAPGVKAWQRLMACGIDRQFDFVITRDDTKKRKPHYLPFREAIKKLRLRSEEILFVGDQPHRDIRGAQRAGMRTCLAEYGLQEEFRRHARKYRADSAVKSIRGVLRLV